MDRRVSFILKELGLWKIFVLVMVLRSPFDFLNACLGANMLERFLRIAELKEKSDLLPAFLTFLLFTVLLFGYNATIWSTISIKADMLLHERLRNKLLKTMLEMEQQEVEQYSEGDWITRINADVDRTADYLTAPLNFMHALIASVNLLLSTAVLAFLNAALLAAALAVMLPFFFLSTVVIIRKVPQYKKNAQEAQASYSDRLRAITEAGSAICVFDGEDIVMKKVEEASLRIMNENIRAHRLSAWSSLFIVFSGNLGYLLLLLMGNSMMGNGIRDFAELTKITQYRGRMMMSVMCVNDSVNRMKTNLPGALRVEEILRMSGKSVPAGEQQQNHAV
ncbi:MAG: hypothetical protein K6E50_13115 [Lachnospiraceae bacterium]|nr:hypothetical protein [Lachnospiraceae bacterium]